MHSSQVNADEITLKSLEMAFVSPCKWGHEKANKMKGPRSLSADPAEENVSLTSTYNNIKGGPSPSCMPLLQCFRVEARSFAFAFFRESFDQVPNPICAAASACWENLGCSLVVVGHFLFPLPSPAGVIYDAYALYLFEREKEEKKGWAFTFLDAALPLAASTQQRK